MKSLNNIFAILLCLMFAGFSALAQQKSISITLDDVPNTRKYEKDNFDAVLLDVLDSLNVPFTIFINENKIHNTEVHHKNKELLEQWIKNDQAVVGNHSYSHSRYSEVGYENFVKDIDQGEILTKQYALNYGKDVRYFRFPFNDMGKDSIQHIQIRNYLKSKGYFIAPFTIESSDWMFGYVYQHYLDIGQNDKARGIGKQYVEKTLAMVQFFEKMAKSIYKRPIKHIYLCHDNAINADYLAEIISRLEQQDGYEIISFEESLQDTIYSQEDTYYKKWGVSWLYRWLGSKEERIEWMKREPDLSEIQTIYKEIAK